MDMSESDSSRPFVVLLGASLVMTGFGAYMMGPASVVPILIRTFGISSTVVGFVFSASYLGWLAFQLPSGFLQDRVDNRRLVQGAVGLLFLATALGTVTESFIGFLGTRVLGGLTGAVLFTGTVTIVGHVFPAERRGLATGTVLGSALGGMALGQVGSPYLAGVMAWSDAFVVYAAISVAGVIVLRFGSPRAVRSGGRVSLAEFLAALTDRSVLLLSIAAFSVNALFIFLNSWIPTYSTTVLSTPLYVAGAMGAVVSVAGSFGRPSGGWLSDAIGSRRIVALGSLVVAVPLLLLIPTVSSWVVVAAILVLDGLALQVGFGVYYAFAQELVPKALTGSSMATLTAFMVLSGLITAPLGGWLKTNYSWTVTFAVFALVGVLGLVAVYVVSETGAGPGDHASHDRANESFR